MEPDLSTIGGRLRWAIDRRPARGRRRGLRLFVADMEKEPVKGVTLPSVTAYVEKSDGRPASKTPSVDFLSAAARICGVSPGWLMSGEGAATEAHREANTLAGLARSDARQQDAFDILNQVRKGMGLSPFPLRRGVVERSGGMAIPHWIGAVSEISVEISAADFKAGDESHDWADIGTAIAAPLRALGISPLELDKAHAFSVYVMSMIAPLVIAARAKAASADSDLRPRSSAKKRARSGAARETRS